MSSDRIIAQGHEILTISADERGVMIQRVLLAGDAPA